MYKNGITHLTAASDLDGALQIINYLMFIPGAFRSEKLLELC